MDIFLSLAWTLQVFIDLSDNFKNDMLIVLWHEERVLGTITAFPPCMGFKRWQRRDVIIHAHMYTNEHGKYGFLDALQSQKLLQRETITVFTTSYSSVTLTEKTVYQGYNFSIWYNITIYKETSIVWHDIMHALQIYFLQSTSVF